MFRTSTSLKPQVLLFVDDGPKINGSSRFCVIILQTGMHCPVFLDFLLSCVSYHPADGTIHQCLYPLFALFLVYVSVMIFYVASIVLVCVGFFCLVWFVLSWFASCVLCGFGRLWQGLPFYICYRTRWWSEGSKHNLQQNTKNTKKKYTKLNLTQVKYSVFNVRCEKFVFSHWISQNCI